MTATYSDAQTRRQTVLVVVMNNEADLRRVASDGWYRIPQRHAPRRIGADYLAFYQTARFKGQPEAQTVTYFAPTRRYRLLTRRELLPDAADHPRADEYYFRIEVGPLQRLDNPVPAGPHRRFAFIHTTFAHLLQAQDVRDLYLKDDPFETLWRALCEHRLRPLANRVVGEQVVDMTLRARGGNLGICCTDDTSTQEHSPLILPERWELVRVAPHDIARDLPGCLRRIGAALLELGGSNLDVGPFAPR